MKVWRNRKIETAIQAEFINALREVLGKDPLYCDGKGSAITERSTVIMLKTRKENKRRCKIRTNSTRLKQS